TAPACPRWPAPECPGTAWPWAAGQCGSPRAARPAAARTTSPGAGTGSSGCASGSACSAASSAPDRCPDTASRLARTSRCRREARSLGMTLRVVVADDQALVRVGFCGIIAATPGFTVVGEAGDGAEAVETARRTSTDVRALILTTFDLDEYVFAALRAGASGFPLKDTLPADLLTAIRVVAAGDALLAPSVTRRLIGEFTRAFPGAGSLAAARATQGAATSAQDDQVSAACDRLQRVLTERELEVLRMVARGMSNAEIAEELTISPATA